MLLVYVYCYGLVLFLEVYLNILGKKLKSGFSFVYEILNLYLFNQIINDNFFNIVILVGNS